VEGVAPEVSDDALNIPPSPKPIEARFEAHHDRIFLTWAISLFLVQ